MQLLLGNFVPLSACGQYILNTTMPGIRNPEKHIKTLSQILAVEELPSHDDVVDLLFFSEVVGILDQDLHQRLFGDRNVASHPSDTYMHGVLSDKQMFHILTKEFVRALVDELNAYGVTGPITEVGAGTGKLSYWMTQYGLQTDGSDINPKVSGEMESNPYVEAIAVDDIVLQYPRVILSSWLVPPLLMILIVFN